MKVVRKTGFVLFYDNEYFLQKSNDFYALQKVAIDTLKWNPETAGRYDIRTFDNESETSGSYKIIEIYIENNIIIVE